jgi:hypothetical protein
MQDQPKKNLLILACGHDSTMNDTYTISQSALYKVRCEYNVAFEQAHPRRLNFYVYLEQAHGIVNIVAEGYGDSWQYQATFDNEKAATAFLLRA